MLATGGTIASTHAADGTVSPARSAEELVAAVGRQTPVVTHTIASTTSWNLTPEIMSEVASHAATALRDGRVKGVVVTHGTDTLEQTAFLTDLLVGDATAIGPIVFTCSMRAADEIGSDGPRNLAHALRVAGDAGAVDKGVLVVTDDRIHAARWVTKLNGVLPPAFDSPEHGAVATIRTDHIDWTRAPVRSPRWTGPIETAVAVVACYPGMDPTIVDHVVERGAKGLVLEGTGAGNVPGALDGAITSALRAGVVVCVATRCPFGGAAARYGTPGGGRSLAEQGVVTVRHLNPLKARIALMALLGTYPTASAARVWVDAGF